MLIILCMCIRCFCWQCGCCRGLLRSNKLKNILTFQRRNEFADQIVDNIMLDAVSLMLDCVDLIHLGLNIVSGKIFKEIIKCYRTFAGLF